MASWDFSDSADGWVFEAGSPAATGQWANQRLEVSSPLGWTYGRWYYAPTGTYGITGATLGGTAHHGGNNFMYITILYDDDTYDRTLYDSPFASGAVSVAVTAGNDGKEVKRLTWECWSIHDSSGVNWFDDAVTSGLAVAVAGVSVSEEACGEVDIDYTFTATITPTDVTAPITYIWSSDGLQSGQGTASAVYNWSTPGVKTVEVSAENAYGGPFSASTTINVSAGSIRADIYEIVSAVSTPNPGQVHDYKRWAVLYPDYLALFKFDIGGSDYIRGCDVEAGPFTEERLEFHSTGMTGILRTWTFYVNGYLTWNDADESEKTAEALADAVGDALDDSDVLHSSCHYYHAEPAQLVNYEPRLFGSVLIHYFRIQQNVTEYLA